MIAHLNLREEYLPFKKLIAEVLIDKNPQIRTVINKTHVVGEESEFRTFKYEVLAGPDEMSVELREGNCIFKFDYSKVYWNSRLQTEHQRLVDKFRPGEVVVDVMAGIGPFALPAGKKKVYVWANDLNPESYKFLCEGIERNKVNFFFLILPLLSVLMAKYIYIYICIIILTRPGRQICACFLSGWQKIYLLCGGQTS